MVKKTFAALCLLLSGAVGTAGAQSPSPADGGDSFRRESRDNEIGVRYGVHAGVGRAVHSAMQCVSLEYARYNYLNIGFRTGADFFPESVSSNCMLGVPLHFTWRTWQAGKRRNASPDLHGHYWNGHFYPDDDYGRTGTLIGDLVGPLLPELPSVLELHAGITPGMLLGARSASEWTFDRRFTCTVDLGGRLMLPIGRVRILLDLTYHCYVTRNFRHRISGERCGRSFVGIGGGVAVDF